MTMKRDYLLRRRLRTVSLKLLSLSPSRRHRPFLSRGLWDIPPRAVPISLTDWNCAAETGRWSHSRQPGSSQVSSTITRGFRAVQQNWIAPCSCAISIINGTCNLPCIPVEGSDLAMCLFPLEFNAAVDHCLHG